MDHAPRKPSECRGGLAILRAAQEALRYDVTPLPELKATAPTTTATAPPLPATQSQPKPKRPRPPRSLNPNQISAARMLLAGSSVTETALALGVNRYTITRWKADPRFQAEVRRQVAATEARHDADAQRAAQRHTAPHFATLSNPPARNEPKFAAAAGRYSDRVKRAILALSPANSHRNGC